MDTPNKLIPPKLHAARPLARFASVFAVITMVGAPFLTEVLTSKNDCSGHTAPNEVPLPDGISTEPFLEMGAPHSAVGHDLGRISLMMKDHPDLAITDSTDAVIVANGRAYDSDYQMIIADVSKPGVHMRVHEGKKREFVGEHVGFANMSYAVNANYFAVGSILGPSIVANGEEHGTRETSENAFIGITQDGRLVVPHMSAANAQKNPLFVAGVTGRMTLLHMGTIDHDGLDHDREINQNGPIFTDETLNCKDDRTAIATDEFGKIVVLFTTIQTEFSQGMTAAEVALSLKSLEFVSSAVLMDGGKSADAAIGANGQVKSFRSDDRRRVANQFVIDENEIKKPAELAPA